MIAFRNQRNGRGALSPPSKDVLALIEEAFAPVEDLLEQPALDRTALRLAVEEAKHQCLAAMDAVEAASIAQAEGTVEAVKVAEQVASENVMAAVAEAVDFCTSEMAPPFLDENSCLVPGEPVVRVEKALENSRRIL